MFYIEFHKIVTCTFARFFHTLRVGATKTGPVRKEKTMNYEELNAYVLRAQLGDRDAAEILCEALTPMILSSMRTYRAISRPADRDDLVQIGYEALLGAIRDFDAARGVYFLYFLKVRLYAALRTETRRRARASERDVYDSADEDGITFDWPDVQARAPFDQVELRQSFEILSPRERQAMEFVLATSGTMRELAEQSGVGVETAKTWLKRARKKLQTELGKDRRK
ncbi:hypothetical protein ATW55_13970 [Ferroacidibacillus organovorans]|uniref:RNA polymerase sigma factor SigS n=2 Tax=Ferroacidibacillus organovorans TaxID=1765683 RepID=A0A117SXD5_9BACL|nr:hypothetical protein ATW55_13970 [Ferroacidibacillus organovorans]